MKQLLIFVFLTARLLAQSATGSAHTNSMYFLDDFSTNKYNWEFVDNEKWMTKMEEGNLVIQNKTAGYLYYSNDSFDKIDDSQNFIIETRVLHMSGVDNYGFGLLYGFKNGQFFNTFKITDGGYFSVNEISNNERTRLIDWQYSDAIKTEGFNILAIKKINDQLFFMINGSTVGQLPYKPFFGDQQGFFVDYKQTFSADYFAVKRVDADEQIASKRSRNSETNLYNQDYSAYLFNSDKKDDDKTNQIPVDKVYQQQFQTTFKKIIAASANNFQPFASSSRTMVKRSRNSKGSLHRAVTISFPEATYTFLDTIQYYAVDREDGKQAIAIRSYYNCARSGSDFLDAELRDRTMTKIIHALESCQKKRIGGNWEVDKQSENSKQPFILRNKDNMNLKIYIETDRQVVGLRGIELIIFVAREFEEEERDAFDEMFLY